nr:dihydrodipicolinate synthase family protein [Actinomycetota bacterium]
MNGPDLDADLGAYHDAGATAVLVAPPFYFPLDRDGVLRFYTGVADRSPLPIVLYNIPAMTKISIPPTVAGELAAHPMIAGMKDSSRDMEYFAEVLDATSGAEDF